MEKENQTDAFIHMHSLGSDEEMSNTQNISTNKFITRITKKARINAKSPTCPVCGKKCSSFCNSHSVPLFTLQNIAEQGNVYIPLQGELPATGNYTGIKKAGTFHLICDNCDNTIFRDYETPAAYDQPPSDKMLAQKLSTNDI